MGPFVRMWVRAFAFTLAVELPVVVAMTRASTVSLKRRVGITVLANLASHPLVWFVFPELGVGYTGWLILAEVWAVVVECMAYAMQFDTKRAAVVSLSANVASLTMGPVLRESGFGI